MPCAVQASHQSSPLAHKPNDFPPNASQPVEEQDPRCDSGQGPGALLPWHSAKRKKLRHQPPSWEWEWSQLRQERLGRASRDDGKRHNLREEMGRRKKEERRKAVEVTMCWVRERE